MLRAAVGAVGVRVYAGRRRIASAGPSSSPGTCARPPPPRTHRRARARTAGSRSGGRVSVAGGHPLARRRRGAVFYLAACRTARRGCAACRHLAVWPSAGIPHAETFAQDEGFCEGRKLVRARQAQRAPVGVLARARQVPCVASQVPEAELDHVKNLVRVGKGHLADRAAGPMPAALSPTASIPKAPVLVLARAP